MVIGKVVKKSKNNEKNEKKLRKKLSNPLIILIRGYQKFISPLTPRVCRFEPTCSQYMLEAIVKHGTLRGLLMGMARLARCHPFTTGGNDPVPDHFTLRRTKN